MPRFAPQNLSKIPSLPSYSSVIASIAATDGTRTVFMGLVLQKLGLQVNEEEHVVPSLTQLHLTSHTPAAVSELVAGLSEVLTVVDGDEYIKGESDVFQIEKPGSIWSVKKMKRAVSAVSERLPTVTSLKGDDPQGKPSTASGKTPETKEEAIQDCIKYTAAASSDQILDYDKIIKTIVPHDNELPSLKETPFHHEAFYANLHHYHNKLQNPAALFGRHLMYGEVVTSTNSLLEKNPSLLRNLPNGFTLTAATQLAGRGRGGNVWVSPSGALMFSLVLHHSMTLSQSAPVVFIQYLSAMATVQGIKNYAPGYSNIPVKLKWPNDIYAQLPGSANNPVVKIGGVLVNSSYSGDTYDLVAGVGINLANDLPTTSLNLLASSQSPPLKPFTHEKLLASILAHFESLYTTFCQRGFTREMETEYYDTWLHTDQVVTLETEGGVKARIKGITRDWGLLLAEELRWEDRPTGRMITLQSDSNSFDFFRGLVRRKV
jgi:biotin--protein ligase